MEKPNANIEWYEDGWTLAEQATLKSQSEIKFHTHATENYHIQKQTEIISQLRTQLAANEEYIKELEEGITLNNKVTELQETVDRLQEQLNTETEKTTNLKKEYSALSVRHQKMLEDPEFGVEKYKTRIKKLEEEVKALTATRDHLIYELNK